jgi:hypothetical protein
VTRGYPARPTRPTRAYYRPHPVRRARPARRPTAAAYIALGLGVTVLTCLAAIILAAAAGVVDGLRGL